MDEMRKAFEAWATAEPREWDISRFDGSAPWPGGYHSYPTQCAWEAWQAACAAERKGSAMTNEEIHKIALAHGFRDRPQSDGTTDLNAYVYAFARAMFEAGVTACVEPQEPFVWYDDESGETYTVGHVKEFPDHRLYLRPLYAAPVSAVGCETASVLQALIDFAVERTSHRYGEKCPDYDDHDVRDPDCTVCRAIERAEKLLTNHTEEDIEMVSVPAGWRLVPAEPTEEMIAAMESQWMCGSQADMAKREYKAALAAAPEAKQ